jgi:hypothetical protein
VIFSRESAAVWPFASSMRIATGDTGAGDGSKHPFIGPVAGVNYFFRRQV